MENIIKISFVMFALSLFALFLLSDILVPETVTFEQAFSLKGKEFVTIEATLENIKQGDDYYMLNLYECNRYKVFADDIPKELKNMSKQKRVKFIASIEEYNGKKNIEPLRFIKIK